MSDLESLMSHHCMNPAVCDICLKNKVAYQAGKIHELEGQLQTQLVGRTTNDHLCELKTTDILGRGYSLVGYVLKKHDDFCIVNGSAVRWLNKHECWRLMHPDNDEIPFGYLITSSISGQERFVKHEDVAPSGPALKSEKQLKLYATYDHGRSWLTPSEMAALERFCETCEDSQGYDVPKEMMSRLAEIGVVRRVTRDIFVITEFGNQVTGRWDYMKPRQEFEIPAFLRKKQGDL